LDGVVASDIDFVTGLFSPIYMYGYSNKATKVVYYTPKVYGFQLGIAVTPDTKHVGHDAKDRTTGKSSNGNDTGIYNQAKDESEKTSGRNHVSIGLSHEYQFNNDWIYKIAVMGVVEKTRPINLKLQNYKDKDSKTPENGAEPQEQTTESKITAKEIKLKNLCSFQTTARVKYKKISIGVGYLNNGKGRMPTTAVYEGQTEDFIPGGFITTKDGNAGQAWNIGGSYAYDEKWTFATVYHHMSRKVSKTEKVQGHAISFTADYLICAGLKLFSELNYVNAKSCDAACKMYNLTHDKQSAVKKQNSTVFVVGAKVTF
jgi:hypothetical protein